MAVSEAQRRATSKYVREKVRTLTVRFYPADADVWEHLDAQENKQGYVRGLIRADMERMRDGRAE